MIRELTTKDVEAYYVLRLAALEEHPEAYTTTAEAWREAPLSKIEAMFQSNDAERRQIVLGLFAADDELVGMLGWHRDFRTTVKHKSALWGMYVNPAWRRQGWGRRLLQTMLGEVQSLPGLELVRLTVSTIGQDAIHLFEAFGFQRYGTEPRARFVDGEYFDVAYMIKFLETNSDAPHV